MDLFNNVLTEKGDIEQLIKENNVTNVSSSLPGLIIQAYLVLVRLFDLNVMEPVIGVGETSDGDTVKVEHIIEEVVNIDDVDSDGAGQDELTGDIATANVSVFGDVTYSSDEADFFLDGSAGAVPMKRDRAGQKRKHTTTDEKVECDICHKHFTRSYIHKHKLSKGKLIESFHFCCYTYFNHIESVHQITGGKDLHTCVLCNKVYVSQANYEKHIQTHRQEVPAINNTAGTVFTTPFNEKHAEFKCEMCDFVAAKKEFLKRHIERHHLEKTIPCDQCNTKFATQQLLRTHVSRVHANGNEPCEYCGKTFKNVQLLAKHIKSSHMERQFQCDICELKFPFMSKLERHMNLHTGEKQFQCDVCDFKTAHKYNLTAHHKSVHMGQKPYHCSMCGVNFNRRGELIKHQKLKHLTTMYDQPGPTSSDQRISSIDAIGRFSLVRVDGHPKNDA